jgi:transglutaminase-like putative cysteine protease
MNISKRRALGVAILIFWSGIVGWHIKREYFKPTAMILAEGARGLAPGSYYYLVRMNDAAIGFARSRFDTLATGYVFEDNIILDVPALDTVHRAMATTRIDLGLALELERFTFELSSEIGRFHVTGVLRPDSQLELQLKAGGQVQKTSMRADDLLMLDAAVPLRLAAGNQLEVGRTFTVRVFDPSTMSDRESQLSITARDTMIVPDSAQWDERQKKFVASAYDTVPVWRIEQSFGSIKIGNWIDEDGHLVKAESPLGFTLERTAYELADQEWKRSVGTRAFAVGYGAVIEQTAIASNVDVRDIESAEQLRVRLGGVELEGFDLAGGRQQLRGDTLVVRRENPAALRASYRLPYRGDADIMRELRAEPLIQSEHPQIAAMARLIVRNTSDPVAATRRLNDWVYHALAKDVTLSVPSALQVLQARQGDCNEHTVLYVALARAIGLPARTAVGLVNVRGRFYYHAWPEVYLNGWVAVDPTLGQYPADASHLRFLIGGLARQVELIRLIGRLSLEKV